MRRVAFIHPDLGIGGAERLVVDAALGLVATGNYAVEIFTSHHDPTRCFPETRDGSLSVNVLGDSIVPASIRGRFVIICAILRQLHLTFSLALSTLLYHFLPRCPNSYFVQNGWVIQPFDVIVVDQLSASIPFLRWLLATRVLFYCHFPDLLLSPGADLSAIPSSSTTTKPSSTSFLKLLYRIPFDAIEHATTGQADTILVNSNFTRGVFHKTFPEIPLPQVLYPAIDTSKFIPLTLEDSGTLAAPDTFLSINRFETKKQHSLALEAFAELVSKYDASGKSLRLIIAGGYDERIMDNLLTLDSLQNMATSLNLKYKIYNGTDPELSNIVTTEGGEQKRKSHHEVIFVRNLSDQHKIQWMGSHKFAALLYTAQNEHLGIVPLEAMSCGLPVLACNNGGPVETILDIPTHTEYNGEGTGLLRPADPKIWSQAMIQLLNFNNEQRNKIRQSCVRRAHEMFSLDTMTDQLSNHLENIININPYSLSIYSESSFLKFFTGLVLSFVFASLSFFIIYTTK